MAAFYDIEQVKAPPQFGSAVPKGWGFTLWADPAADPEVHRRLLEGFAEAYPASRLSLADGEDLIEGSLEWEGAQIWIWFEAILRYTWLWSSKRSAVVSLRGVLMPMAEAMGS